MRAYRSWNAFDWFNPKQHVEGYVSLIKEKVTQGWKPTFLTFQFQQLPGKTHSVLDQMKRGIELVYRRLVPRVQRFPTTKNGSMNLPILLSAADLPVYKHQKKSLAEVSINNGVHHHGIIVMPPRSRLKTDLVTHFGQEQGLYLPATRLMSIYAEAVDDNLETVVGYAFKGVTSRRMNYDDSFLVFPRALTELD